MDVLNKQKLQQAHDAIITSARAFRESVHSFRDQVLEIGNPKGDHLDNLCLVATLAYRMSNDINEEDGSYI